VIPTLAPHAQLLLLPGFICLMRHRGLLWRRNSLLRLILVATGVLLVWPWAASAGLLIAAIHYPAASLVRFWQLPLYTSPVLPLAVSVSLGCLLQIQVPHEAPFGLESTPNLQSTPTRTRA
jgi:hypothetical protein